MTKRILMMMAAVLIPASAWAGMLGQSVTGTLTFAGGGTNYFNSVNGFVPGGCLNSGTGSATVTIGAGTEFCFQDGSNRDWAEFTDTQLIITDRVLISSASNASFQMTFTFAPGLVMGVTEISDSFPGGMNFSLLGNVLTMNWGGGIVSSTQNLESVYNFETSATVPEPSTTVLMGAGIAALVAWRRRLASRRD